jgi:hypothetical protein
MVSQMLCFPLVSPQRNAPPPWLPIIRKQDSRRPTEYPELPKTPAHPLYKQAISNRADLTCSVLTGPCYAVVERATRDHSPPHGATVIAATKARPEPTEFGNVNPYIHWAQTKHTLGCNMQHDPRDNLPCLLWDPVMSDAPSIRRGV